MTVNQHQSKPIESRPSKSSKASYGDSIGLYVYRLVDFSEPLSLTLVSANSAAAQMTGVKTQSIIGKTIGEAFPNIAETQLPEQYAQVVHTQKPLTLDKVDYSDRRVDEATFSYEAFPLGTDCVCVAFENVTQRRLEWLLRHEQAAQLKVLFNQAAVGIARLSPEGHWIQVNQRLCDILGYSFSELLGKSFQEVTHPDDADLDGDIYNQLVQKKTDNVNFEKRYLTKSGDTIWADVTVSNVYDATGRLAYFVATIQDITERRQFSLRLQQQKDDLLAVNMMLTNTMATLEQRNEELDQFAYVASHDLKSPLRAIANLTTWIEEDLGESLQAHNAEQFKLLKNRVHRMEGLINGLLEYSRVGRTHQSHEQVDVSKIIEGVIETLEVPAEFIIDVVSPMPVFEAKRVPLTQVFLNLIDNAIKHHQNSKSGKVTISAHELADYHEFTVTDNGPGIETNYHEKIFEIFQTLQPRDELETTGIGLSIVQKMVHTEGGEITVESVPTEGATFTFTWPKMPRKISI